MHDVLNGFYACRAGERHRLVVDDVFLKPEIWDAELDHIFDDWRDFVRRAKNIDKIDSSEPSLFAAACADSRSG